MTSKEINNLNSIDVDINKATPMLKQYLEIKKQNQGIILMYRMGDFYEAFFEDATTIAQDLEITLTARDGGDLGKIPMAGVPAKALNNYIPKLLEKGHKISICEQLEDASETKGLVKRGIVKTITAGTLTESTLLESNSNNYLAALIYENNIFGLSYTDISTGEFKVTQGPLEDILSELSRLKPAEILAPVKKQKVLPFQIVPEEKIDLPEIITKTYSCTKMPYSAYEESKAIESIKALFNVVSLDSFGFSQYKTGFFAAGAIVQYLFDTQKDNLPKFDVIKPYGLSEFVSIDANTRRNLELTETTRDKVKYGSLLWAIDKIKTNMGSRLLKQWINQPVKNVSEILKRQNAVEELINDSQARLYLTNLLEKVYDIERLAIRLSNSSANPRDFLAIKDTLSLLPNFESVLKNFEAEYLNCLSEDNSDLMEFASILERTINEEAPVSIKEGSIIKEGVNGDLDYYKSLLTGGEKWLSDFENSEREKTGIKNLRVGYSKTFGYFIEITNSNLSSAPANYIRRQTLTNAERFITDELKKHENEVLSAQYKSTELEYKIFTDLREYAKEYVDKIKEIAQAFSRLDVLLSFASTAIELNYVKPEITESNELFIKDGRHPVVEKILPMGKYVSNDLKLTANINNPSDTQFMILTGPNMAGKSTYMRQNALIVVLAQIGSFVPATYARIGIVDKIFTRVGAVDDLSLGQSTFMVEMSETAYILNSATEKSLILLDEIGRGTSTYDGVAIAWSVAEYIATKIKARTIFATHYHELNVMPKSIEQIKNYRITISEQEGEIEFLRKVVEGSASKSYGIQVAKMAGLPNSVIGKAQTLMTKMQKDFSKDLSSKKVKPNELEVPQLTLTFD